MSKTMRGAVIGCGVIAPSHIEAYLHQKNLQLKYACDLVAEKAEALAEKYDISEVTTDYREVLADEEVNLVSVCTDHGSHSEIAVAAMNAGKHVLCEKSLASSSKGLDEMIAAHQKNPEVVFAGVFQHRFEAIPRYMKSLVDENAFGTILTAGMQCRCLRTDAYYNSDAWRGTWAQEGGSVLVNQAIHFIDLLAWIMGGVESLAGAHANLTHGDTIETEDTAVAALRFHNGALGSLEATASSHLGWEYTLSIHGSSGSIDVRNGRALKIDFEDPVLSDEVQRKFSACVDAPTEVAGKDYYGRGHLGQITDFIDAIRSNRPPCIPGEAARHAVDIALAIYRSHKEAGWVEV